MAFPAVESSTTAAVDLTQTLTLDMPGTADSTDDLLVAVLNATNVASVWAELAGWTEIGSGTDSGTSGAAASSVQVKLWDSGDPATFTFTQTSGIDRAAQGSILCLPLTNNTPDVLAFTNDGNLQSTSIPTPDATTTQDETLVFRIFTGGTGAITANSAPLEARNRVDICATTGGRRVHVCDEDQATSGASGAETATSTNSVGHMGYTIALVSVAPPEPPVPGDPADRLIVASRAGLRI